MLCFCDNLIVALEPNTVVLHYIKINSSLDVLDRVGFVLVSSLFKNFNILDEIEPQKKRRKVILLAGSCACLPVWMSQSVFNCYGVDMDGKCYTTDQHLNVKKEWRRGIEMKEEERN